MRSELAAGNILLVMRMPASWISMALYDDVQRLSRLVQARERSDSPAANSERPGSADKTFERILDDQSGKRAKWSQITVPAIWRDVVVAWLLAVALLLTLFAFPTPDMPKADHAASPSLLLHTGARTHAADGSDADACSDLDYAYERC